MENNLQSSIWCKSELCFIRYCVAPRFYRSPATHNNCVIYRDKNYKNDIFAIFHWTCGLTLLYLNFNRAFLPQ